MPETPQIKFRAGHENEWISTAPVSNGEFDCWLRIKLYDFGNDWKVALHHREARSRYLVELAAIAPKELSVEQVTVVAEAACVHITEVNVSDIGDHGFCAYLHDAEGDSKQKLIADIKEWAQWLARPEVFSLQMDRFQTPTGKTGWDAIKGNI